MLWIQNIIDWFDFFLFINKFQTEQVSNRFSYWWSQRDLWAQRRHQEWDCQRRNHKWKIPEQAVEETDSNRDATFSEVSEELEDNLLRKVVPQFFAIFIEHCISVSISFFSCLFWNFFSASFFFDCFLDVLYLWIHNIMIDFFSYLSNCRLSKW